MKTNWLTTSLLSLVALVGCAQNPADVEPISTGESWTAVYDSAVNNAIIAQQALFPYHFKVNSAELNELGDKDLAVLMAHYQNHPGELHIRRGDASVALYDQRVRAVAGRLEAVGLQIDRIPITDGVANGSGLGNEQILINIERRNTPPSFSGDESTSSFGTSTSGTMGPRS